MKRRFARKFIPLVTAATLVMAISAFALVARAADEAKPARPSVDDALLRDLDNDLLEGAGELKKSAAPKAGDKKPARDSQPRPEGDDAKEPEEMGEDLGEPSEDQDPLGSIGHKMRTSEELIRALQDRPGAEKLQKQIVDELEKLIDQAQKQGSSAKSSGKQDKNSQKTTRRKSLRQVKSSGKRDSNKPARDSSDRLSKSDDAKPDPRRMKEMMKDSWGHLPPHAREEMSQNWPERFLPQYELLIERFYKRLAEEQSSK